jgi:nickel/cobalt exporter
MKPGLTALLLTAASIGLIHTLIGPDHYIPFLAMSQARRWTRRKTMTVTFLCGIGHVLSSVVLGLAGIALGLAVARLEGVESTRGEIAAWLMIGFGLAYFLWGLKRAWRNKRHSHRHFHGGALFEHEHDHAHHQEHVHVHDQKANITPWVLFTIFVFGPCEPLIPLLVYPAARLGPASVALITIVFAAATIGTMLAVVRLGSLGLRMARWRGLERYMHAAAGAMIFLCGFAIRFLGL